MSGVNGSDNANWHTANGGGLPFRPPTVDEALPYSPFTSIVPFSPDLIPYPSAEPPTPPSTLTKEQQAAANKGVQILNNEAKTSPATSETLHSTLAQLRNLLNPNELSEFKFKAPFHLVPPSEPPADSSPSNGTASSRALSLSPFASMLLKSTNIAFQLPTLSPHGRASQGRAPLPSQSQTQSRPPPRPSSHSHASTPGSVSSSSRQLIANEVAKASEPSPNQSNTPARPGPAVVITPLPPTVKREEYQRYDEIQTETGSSGKAQPKPNDYLSTMRAQEREIAEGKIAKLYNEIARISTEKEDPEQSALFTTIATDEGELTVLDGVALTRLSQAVSNIVELGCFSSVLSEQVLLVQSLCEPLVTGTSQASLFLNGGDSQDALDRLEKATTGLRACRLLLQTMIEGRDDRQLCSEDLVQGVIKVVKNVLESCIIPVIESRRGGPESDLFNCTLDNKSDVLKVVRLSGSVLTQLATLIGKVRLTAMALSPIESVVMTTLFAQNGEKESDSAIGIQKFETFRQQAMDVLAQIFTCHTDQRDSITSEVLSNLEKLPDKRASARQFKSAREAPIMLVSALFMRFVQAAASRNIHQMEAENLAVAHADHDEESGESDTDTDFHPQKRSNKKNGAKESPKQLASRLWQSAKITASQIAKYLVKRATNVSKSGDKPFRLLLDYFIQDFCTVLGSPEWPAASILLEQILLHMIPLTENVKDKGVQGADMALAVMGSMGSGILDFLHRLRIAKRGLNISQSMLSSRLVPLAEDALSTGINKHDVLGLDGPFRAVLDSLSNYLNPRGSQRSQNDLYLTSLSGYFVTSWAYTFYQFFSGSEDDQPKSQQVIELEQHLVQMLTDPKWLSKAYKFQDVSETESQLAAGIITLQEPFCKYLQQLVQRLILNTKSSSSKIKTRAVASLSILIEKDAQVLNENTCAQFARLLSDSSPSVRASALSLISKCLEKDPSLEKFCLPQILSIMTDSSNEPKKKAIKLLKDIYMSSTARDKKLWITAELLLPILDEEKAVAELARQTMEDIWLSPPANASRMDVSQLRLGRENRVSLLVDTVHRIQGHANHLRAFEAFFAHVLSRDAKNSASNFEICKTMVADMMEGVISTGVSSGEKSQARILQTMGILAKVNSRLFTADQVQLLKLYVENLNSTEDLALFQPTVVIFRYAFPGLPSLQETFLEEVRANLSKAISRLAVQAADGSPGYKDTLLDIAHCLWIISPLVKGDPPKVKSGLEKFFTLIASVATKLEPCSNSTKEQLSVKQEKRRVMSYFIILGTIGQVCNLDKYVDIFKPIASRQVQNEIASKRASPDHLTRLRTWKGTSVAVLILDLILPFTRQSWGTEIRGQALCSLGQICQQNPRHFTRADIDKAFRLPFINEDVELMRIALTQVRDFFALAERRSESGAEIAVGGGAAHGAERLESSFAASDNDSATMHLARGFLDIVKRAALGQADDMARCATEIIVSISRQGLVHPKECGPALVALSTSPIQQVSQTAAAEHQKIHLQHETMFEKEYVSAVRMAFEYQRDIIGDPHGAIAATETTYKPKLYLLFEALKSGSRKTLKKFVSNLFREMHFDMPKMDCTGTIPDIVLFVRFCLENFALFDYARTDEVFHVIANIQSIVLKDLGVDVAYAIEAELAQSEPEQRTAEQENSAPVSEPLSDELQPHSKQQTVPEERIRRLTVASMILHMMWETRVHLRKAYNLPPTGNVSAKDLQKPATKLHFVTGKDLWDSFTTVCGALESRDAMTKECKYFAKSLSIEKNITLPDEEAETSEQLANATGGYDTPNEDDNEAPTPTSGRSRKRKGSSQVGNTPKKARNRLSGNKGKKRSSKTPDGDEDD